MSQFQKAVIQSIENWTDALPNIDVGNAIETFNEHVAKIQTLQQEKRALESQFAKSQAQSQEELDRRDSLLREKDDQIAEAKRQAEASRSTVIEWDSSSRNTDRTPPLAPYLTTGADVLRKLTGATDAMTGLTRPCDRCAESYTVPNPMTLATGEGFVCDACSGRPK